jgi:dienelactone hydrolase
MAACVTPAAHGQTVVPPLPPTGPYPAACTNVEQDFSRVPAGETAEMYWRGVASGGNQRYIDALLIAPASALSSTFVAPADEDLYDRWAGEPVTYVFLACYPTTPANVSADYAPPGGGVVPRMQRGAEPPILPASPQRLPVLLYSHGYGGSPLAGNYLRALIAFASWGYVAVAPFHGDLRYSVFGPEAIALKSKAHIPIWSEFVAMQALRPLSVSAGLDVMLSRAEWRDRVDPNRVGAFGISQGGETLMLLGGAELAYNLFNFDTKRVTHDVRVKAAVGYVPYFGVESVPAFGSDQGGAQGMTLPFLALSGTADPIAPPTVVRAALDQLAGPRGHVLLNGLGHDLDPGSAADVITWSLGFLDAWTNNNASAKAQLIQVDSVDGGLDDHKVLYVDPTGSPGTPGVVVDTIEYYNASLDHYFITAFPEEVALLDAGVQIPGWTRTGYTFHSWKSGTGPGNEACRFFGTPGRGPNSHFYTISDYECDKVKANPDWTFEALAFRAVEPLAGGCPAEYATVTRLYNNGMGGQANHRYLTDPAAIEATVAKGWLVEGPVFCVPR